MNNVGTVEVDGLAEVFAALEQLGAEGQKGIRKAVAKTANKVRRDAISSIQEHRSKGEVYHLFEPKRDHTASAPHNPPNTDTGALVRSIVVTSEDGGMVAKVGSSLAYAYWLEFGTRRMLERPWLIPAVQQNTQFFMDALTTAITEAIEKSGLDK